MTDPTRVRALLRDAYAWHSPPGETAFIARTLTRTGTGPAGQPMDTDETTQVTPAELANLHPQLPLALTTLLAYQHALDGDDEVSAEYLQATLQHWENPLPLVMASGKRRYLFDIRDVQDDRRPKWFNLTVGVYDPRTLQPTASSAPIVCVTRIEVDRCCVHHDWLEQRFPGWKTRYDVARSLDYAKADLADYVCTPSPVMDTTDLAEVNFD